jgi:FkbH-like protein
MLLRYESQSVLFATKISRRDLIDIKLPDNSRKTAVVNVWRNHAFESLIPLMVPYCLFGNWCADFNLGPYDDTLLFNGWRPANIELLWLDSSRFPLGTDFTDWLDWLRSRLSVLRNISKAPVVLATWTLDEEQNYKLQEVVDKIPAVYYANIKKICLDGSVKLLDQRIAALAGSPISNSAQLILAREFACHWLPAVLFAPVKAVAIDLDNTLHRGVLGEDGINGVQLTLGHRDFQQFIKSLRQRGIFIALVSRNERLDVEALFEQRQDYPLRWEDFSAIEVSWRDKAAAIGSIAKALRIAPDAVLFIDDNPGELASVAMQLPQVHTVYAHQDANLTRQVVNFYPGLWRWKTESDDAKRIQDMKANEERETLAENVTDPAEYFRSLQVTLVYRHDPQLQLTRLAELCNKTNQFNLALRRFNQVEVAERLSRGDACVASVQLTDRLSDSGVIAVIIAEREGEQLVVEELCISCRAMGRHLENTIILLALRDMPIFAGCQKVAFRVQHGPRNQPALDWLARLLDLREMPGSVLHTLPSQRLLEYVAAEGVTLIKE